MRTAIALQSFCYGIEQYSEVGQVLELADPLFEELRARGAVALAPSERRRRFRVLKTFPLLAGTAVAGFYVWLSEAEAAGVPAGAVEVA